MLGSSAVGWPPHRYRDEKCAFVVRRMTVVHENEVTYGEALEAVTWVRDFRRGLLTTREIRLTGENGRPIAAATQEWVHVTFGVDDAGRVRLRPSRATPELLASFPEESHDEAPELPHLDRRAEGPRHVTRIPLRLTEMDPLGHVNHPAYVDLVDEHTSEIMMGSGLDPVQLQPIAEQVHFRAGMEAPGAATVRTRLVGWARNHCVLSHSVLRPDGDVAAEAITVRTLAGEGAGRLAAALEAS